MFNVIQTVPLYVWYMFRSVLGPSSGMSIQKSYKEIATSFQLLFYNLKTEYSDTSANEDNSFRNHIR